MQGVATPPSSKDGSRRRRGSQIRQCMTCGRTFAKTDHLERHIRSHTKEKPFHCAICGRKYGRHDTLLRHQKDHLDDDSITPADHTHSGSEDIDRPTDSLSSAIKSPDLPFNGTNLTTAVPAPMTTTTTTTTTTTAAAAATTTTSNMTIGSVHPPSATMDARLDPAMDVTALRYPADDVAYHALPAEATGAKGLYPTAFAAPQMTTAFEPSMEPFDFEAQFPSWLVEGDITAGILDTPLVTTMAELRPGWLESPPTTIGTTGFKPVTASNLRELWFTARDDRLDDVPPSGPTTPPATQVEVDDSYRQTLHQSLQIRSLEQALPSADFLNLCVRSYFARFHPVFPVVHAPTFRPSKANSMVLLSICSVGSLFTGSVHAIRQGVQIFERLHKAVLANWDRLIARGTDERISLIQTAVIGQTFGLLSGEPKHLGIVDAFNGTLISWARRLHTFKTKQMKRLDLNLPPAELERKWREWAKNEELIRIALSAHIHDAELASIFHHEPFLRHNSRQLPVAASHQPFMATRPEDWRLAYLNDPSNFESDDLTPASIDANVDFDILAMPSNSYFTAYTVLEGICVNIVESRVNHRLSALRIDEISHLLTTFHGRFLQGTSPWEADSMDMSILWHSAWMALYADFDLLERAIGRDGAQILTEDHLAVTTWANSDRAKRCVVHGTMIQKKMENLPLGSEPAIHVPRAMFRAGVAWFCYTRFGYAGDDQRSLLNDLDFPEIKLLGVNPASLLFQANGYKHGRPTTTEINAALCGLTDLLRRIGHWEIARRFAAILAALLHNEAD